MFATVILCILSTTVFCACLRATLALVNVRFAPSLIAGSDFSMSARKLARNYAVGAIAILAIVAFVGAVHFYIELFQLSI